MWTYGLLMPCSTTITLKSRAKNLCILCTSFHSLQPVLCSLHILWTPMHDYAFICILKDDWLLPFTPFQILNSIQSLCCKLGLLVTKVHLLDQSASSVPMCTLGTLWLHLHTERGLAAPLTPFCTHLHTER